MSRVESLLDGIAGLSPPLLVALDVDGTLAPIVRNPDLAEIPRSTIATLEGLSDAPGIVLALVTGRDLQSLRRMETLDGIWRAVEHGGVVLGPGETPAARTLSTAQRTALSKFSAWVDANAEGAFIELKPEAIAVHVREVAEHDSIRAARLLQEAGDLAESLGLYVRRGKALCEAEASRHDKGQAVREIFERSGAASILFIGDDLTDFPAIELAADRGFGVFVESSERRGAPPRSATVLSGVEDVAAVLEGLLHRSSR